MSTDAKLTPEQIIEAYGERWSIESMFIQLKLSWGLKEAKAKGVKDMAFHKKKGLKVEEMAKSVIVSCATFGQALKRVFRT